MLTKGSPTCTHYQSMMLRNRNERRLHRNQVVSISRTYRTDRINCCKRTGWAYRLIRTLTLYLVSGVNIKPGVVHVICQTYIATTGKPQTMVATYDRINILILLSFLMVKNSKNHYLVPPSPTYLSVRANSCSHVRVCTDGCTYCIHHVLPVSYVCSALVDARSLRASHRVADNVRC